MFPVNRKGRRAACVFVPPGPFSGVERMPPAGALPIARPALLTSGPGRLCQAFGITRSHDNGADFTSPNSDLQIQDDGFIPGEILITPRIGITKDASRPARYLLAGNPYVSKR